MGQHTHYNTLHHIAAHCNTRLLVSCKYDFFFFCGKLGEVTQNAFLSFSPPPSLPLSTCVFTYSVGCLAGCGLVSCDASLVTEFLDTNRGHQVVGVESEFPAQKCSSIKKVLARG